MLRKFSIMIVLAVGLALTTTAAAQEVIAIPGTGDGVAILEAIGEAFTAETGIKVSVPKSIGSGGGIKVVGEGKALIGRVARNIKDNETPLGLTYTPFVKVPTVFFVHPSVNIDGLTSQQVTDIYSGKITNWQQVGGQDKKIVVIRREDGDSSLGNLKKSFPGFKELVITTDARIAEKTPQMIDLIIHIEDTIGFGPLDVALANNLKFLAVDSKDPFDAGYPTYGTIAFIYKQENLTGNIKEFVDFAKSEAAHSVIKKAGGLPL